jgi:hypothetical protein
MKKEKAANAEKGVGSGENSRKSKGHATDDTIEAEDVDVLRSIGRKSVNNFTSDDIKKSEKWAKKFYKELGVKSPFFRAWFGEWRAHERFNYVNVQKMERREGKNPRGQYRNGDTNWIINSSSVGYDETTSHSGRDRKSIIAMQNIDKIIENAILLETEVSEHGRGKKSVYTAFMHKFYALVDIDGIAYLAKMAVDESYSPGQNETNKKFYHVRAIKIETVSSVGIGKSHTPIMEQTASDISVADLYEFVKRFDKDFTVADPVSKEVLNEDGTPKVFYHGTNSDFSVFDLARSGSNFGATSTGLFFFTDKKNASPSSAEDYARYATEKHGGQVESSVGGYLFYKQKRRTYASTPCRNIDLGLYVRNAPCISPF